MNIFNCFARMNSYLSMVVATVFAIVMLTIPAPAMAQQTVDPTIGASCTIGSAEVAIIAQTGTFICFATAGASTGTWRKSGQTGMRVAYALYNFAVDGGAIATITPAVNSTIPANAIIIGGILNPTTALTSGGSATIAVGTAAGSSTSALKAATAVASYTIDALMPTVPVFTAGSSVKLSAAGAITITVAVATLTAGVMEIMVFYVVPTNA